MSVKVGYAGLVVVRTSDFPAVPLTNNAVSVQERPVDRETRHGSFIAIIVAVLLIFACANAENVRACVAVCLSSTAWGVVALSSAPRGWLWCMSCV